MAKPRQTGPSLFDMIEVEDDRAAAASGGCQHRHEDKTETDWGAPYGWRMTYTCRACKRVRGRATG